MDNNKYLENVNLIQTHNQPTLAISPINIQVKKKTITQN